MVPRAPPLLPRRRAPSGDRGWETSSAWLAAALLTLFLVALVSGAVVAVVATNGEETAGGVLGTSESLETATGGVTVTVPAARGPISSPRESGATAAPPAGRLAAWPAGKDGFTIVLASVPVASGRSSADALAAEAATGLDHVGVLDSSSFTTLRPGYYVVFAGVFDTTEEAQAGLPRARTAMGSDAYVREIAR